MRKFKRVAYLGFLLELDTLLKTTNWIMMTVNTGGQVNSELQDPMLTGSSLHPINKWCTRHKEGALTKFGHWSIAGQITASGFFNNVPTLVRWKMVTQIWTGEFQCQNHVLKETANAFQRGRKEPGFTHLLSKSRITFVRTPGCDAPF